MVEYNDLFVSSLDTIEENDAILEENIHAVLICIVVIVMCLSLEDVDVGHLRQMLVMNLVGPDRLLGCLLWEQISIAIHEPVDQDLIILQHDTSNDSIW